MQVSLISIRSTGQVPLSARPTSYNSMVIKLEYFSSSMNMISALSPVRLLPIGCGSEDDNSHDHSQHQATPLLLNVASSGETHILCL